MEPPKDDPKRGPRNDDGELARMERVSAPFSPRLKRRGFYWVGVDEAESDSAETVWDGLAREDAVYYAVRAETEEQEEAKSRAPVRILGEQLREGSVLDLGCGYGRIAKYLLPATEKVHEYLGLDRSEQMLKLFYDRNQNRPVEQTCPLTLIKSDIDEIPLEDDSVDNVITSAVYLHNPKHTIAQSIREVVRVLRPGGRLFAFSSFPNRFSLNGVQGACYLWILRCLGEEGRNGPIRYFSKGELEALLQEFSSVTIYEHGFAVLPKSIVVFPSFLNRVYRATVFEPSQWIFQRVLSRQNQKRFCAHFDVVSQK